MSLEVPEQNLDLLWSPANLVRNTGQYHTEYQLRKFERLEREQLREKGHDLMKNCNDDA